MKENTLKGKPFAFSAIVVNMFRAGTALNDAALVTACNEAILAGLTRDATRRALKAIGVAVGNAALGAVLQAVRAGDDGQEALKGARAKVTKLAKMKAWQQVKATDAAATDTDTDDTATDGTATDGAATDDTATDGAATDDTATDELASALETAVQIMLKRKFTPTDMYSQLSMAMHNAGVDLDG